MSRAKVLNCRCRYGLPQVALRIPLLNVSGKHGPDKLLLEPICNGLLYAMRPPLTEEGDIDTDDPEYGEVWSVESTTDKVFRTGDPARPYIVKTTISSFAVGGVVVEVRYTDVDGLAAKYENMNPYEPQRGVTMLLVDHDTTANAVNWHDFVCLRPAMDVVPTDCYCEDGRLATVMFVVEPGDYEGDGFFFHEYECEVLSKRMAGTSGDHTTFHADETVDTDHTGACGYNETREDVGSEFALVINRYVAFGSVSAGSTSSIIHYGLGTTGAPDFRWSLTVDRAACDIAINGGTFELEHGSLDPICENETATVRVTIIPLNSNGEVRTPVEDNPCAPKYCGGVSQSYLRRDCYDGEATWIYYWELSSDAACKGECASGECNASAPFQLVGAASQGGQSMPLDDETAEDLGYLDLLDTLVDGGCGCDATIDDVECPECNCDDETEDKSFTEGRAWTMTKGGNPCAVEETCCWGEEAGLTNSARLFWDSGTGFWSLVIVYDTGSGLASALYELEADACTSPLVLNFVSSGGVFYSWPGTITVS